MLQKVKILDRLKNGEKPTILAKSLNLNESTIQKNEQKIRRSVSIGTADTAKRVSYVRGNLIEKMEKALSIWIESAIEKHIPLDTNVIKQKALKIFKNNNNILFFLLLKSTNKIRN